MTQHPFKPILLPLLRQAQSSQNAFFQELLPVELTAIGTPDYWSAKDHVAHMTFWRQRLIFRLQAILRNMPQPQSEDFVQLNPVIFEKHRFRSWSELLSESDAVYTELFALTEQLTETDGQRKPRHPCCKHSRSFLRVGSSRSLTLILSNCISISLNRSDSLLPVLLRRDSPM